MKTNPTPFPPVHPLPVIQTAPPDETPPAAAPLPPPVQAAEEHFRRYLFSVIARLVAQLDANRESFATVLAGLPFVDAYQTHLLSQAPPDVPLLALPAWWDEQVAAFERGYSPASIVLDAPVVFRDRRGHMWRPQNDSGNFAGPMLLRRALVQSRNLVSVRLLDAIGVEYARRFISHFGIDEATIEATRQPALVWALERGSRSGRVAWQFARDFAGRAEAPAAAPAPIQGDGPEGLDHV